MNIENDPILENFFLGRNLEPNTKDNYYFAISKFCTIVHKTPSELVDEAEEDEDKGLKPRKRRIKKYFLQFTKEAEEEGLSPRYIRSITNIMRIFYREFDIEIPKINYKLKDERKSTYEDIPTLDDIKLALQKANLTYQAIILTMTTSGMGRSEVLSLTYQDYLNAISEPLNLPRKTYIDIVELKKHLEKNKGIIGKWHIQRVKTRHWFDTFTTWECLHKIAEYLVTQPAPELESALFRTIDNYGEYVKPLGESGFMSYFQRLNRRCNFGHAGRQAKFRSHNLRKYFVNALLRSGVPKFAIDWMIGHELQDKSAEPYFKSDPNYLLNEYMKGVDKLSVEHTEVVRLESEEYKELKKKNNALKQDMTQMQIEKDNKITALEKRLELMEKLLSDDEFRELMNKKS